MGDYGKWKKLGLNLLICMVALIFTWSLLETGFRLYKLIKRSMAEAPVSSGVVIPLHIPCEGPLYRLNPDHPEVNAQGLRDRLYQVPKPEGCVRIMALGDSLVFGDGVELEQTFPKILEARLEGNDPPVEVISAGVRGYTTFNELHYYLSFGRFFEPDIVLLTFCLNDVVNPRLHWNYAPVTIPDEAIPNLDYDREKVLPLMEERKHRPFMDHFALYRYISKRLEGRRINKERHRQVGDTLWPIYLTSEDTLSIECLMDPDSPEWRWLKSLLKRLDQAVEDNGARLAIMAVPLAYQLDENYPFIPQRIMAQFCSEEKIPFLDVLPLFREHGEESLFIGEIPGIEGYTDIWHLSPAGHLLAAEALEPFLKTLF